MTADAAGMQRQARKLLPPDVYDYYAGGSGRGRTLRASEKAWGQAWLAPRVLRDVSAVSTRVELLGAAVATPVGVAPTAFHGLAHPDGELASAAGAARAGALYVLSTRSTRRIEDVAAVIAAESGSWWFQVYVMRDRELTAGLVRRAAAAGAGALVLTGDTPIVGRLRHPHGDGTLPEQDYLVNLGKLDDLAAASQARDATFADIGWLAELSGGLPVVVKGVLRADDALACAAAGAAAVIVSNHGGRQLDGAVPAAWALPPVASALARTGQPAAGQPSACPQAAGQQAARPDPGRAGPCRVFADGGIRTGGDVLAALALGAGAVFVGRPVLWALATGGAEGVRSLLAGMTADLARSMSLAGARSVAAVAGTGYRG